MRLLSFSIALLYAVTAVPASAAVIPEPGARVRVTARTPGNQQWIGPLVSVARDTITLSDDARDSALVAVPTVHVGRLDVSGGIHHNALGGAALGLAIGALLGAGIGYAEYHKDDFIIYTPSESAAAGAVALGGIGLVLGTAVGAMMRSERWQAVPMENLRKTGP